MWQLLMPLALWLGAVGLGRAELTAAQQRGLQVALEEFHKHPPVQWAFRETGVDSATETVSGIAKWRRLGRDGARSQEAAGCWPFSVCGQPFPAGTFVRLEFKLQQTSCRKKDWKKAECKIKPNGRKRKCLACIKLNSADKVLGRMVHCPIHTQALRDPEEHQEAQCGRVERAGEDPHSYYFPGQFAFFKALPPS
ncbi:retinoic acid receptor responder protein 2 isoform X1 [Mustela nigripes]|uniref:retinoic acid receptor responder protein 2 isoform X1 n=1 Tax=Mustela nigripes TaxID=77151 RepID=UPI002814E17B|nr:retinoic acid receptor responder protein 2 isoform X1 [Mustela nigripes]XP_059252136.1 retinoic acid receptor responder protein 2 isoform X1 [Mustela nigripes]XP_059252137.1 retinoic acid receptor responder protein 2 isoform X1 [Mustela nigripes]